ncbi:Poly [ADP-ribose] polymerase 2 [Podila horticola]|nr:Poly [ADP-ribose] polymerase 2 [Podila horticola]
MPPKRVPLFSLCGVAISGTYKTHTQGDISALITTNGGVVTPSVTKATTHLITTDKELEKNTTKVQKALEMGIFLVTLDWVIDSISKKKRQNEDLYKVSDGSAAVAIAAAAPATPADTPGSSTPDSTSNKRKADDELDGAVDKKIKDLNKKVVAKAAKASSSAIKRPPVDRSCTLPPDYEVYVDSVVAWNARLNQTNINANNNKFYLIQLLGNPRGQYAIFCHWGRVGAHGQTQVTHCGDINNAMKEFKKKFIAKSGNQWEDRDKFEKVPRKYFLLPPDDGDSDDEDEESSTKAESGVKKEHPIPESKLHPKVQSLMGLIFNTQMMNRQMKELDYDADKMPLGKLAKSTILHAYEILKKISEAMDKPSANQQNILAEFSSDFYTAIPHDFGRRTPPIIDNAPMLKKKLEMLESLGEIEIAQKLIKENKTLEKALDVNPLDSQFASLKLNKLEPMDKNSERFKLIEQYTKNTHGATHSAYDLVIDEVFDLDRQGEEERYKDSGFDKLHNRRLLWHGSRLTNYVGILSQGLRIAPPEAPSTGYMFDKGAYFADCVSKSANYCFTNPSDNTGLMLLCEVSLGDMFELQNADYNAKNNSVNAKKHSTKGCGRTYPDEAQDVIIENDLRVQAGTLKDKNQPQPGFGFGFGGLQYNEYIVYNTSQIKMRYLLKMRFDYKKRW